MPTWDEMKAKLDADKKIQDERNVLTTGYPRQLKAMHMAHGASDGQHCRDCAHLVKVRGDMAIQPFKCIKYRISSSAASDWRLKWPACGLFQKREAI